MRLTDGSACESMNASSGAAIPAAPAPVKARETIMEGPCLRRFPRIALDKAVEVRGGEAVIMLENARGNLSIGGLFVTTGGPLPSGEIHLRICGSRPFESRGTVRHRVQGGAGIEFADLPEAARRELEQLIAELTRDGSPAA